MPASRRIRLQHKDIVMDFSSLLDTLGYAAGEYVSVNWMHPGGQFRSAVVEVSDAPAKVASLGTDCNIWFGVNPTSGPAREGGGRGSEDDVTRVSALIADLDVKKDNCTDLAHARRIIAALSEKLGTNPVAIIRSGYGLQPYWHIEDGGPLTDAGRQRAKALIRRWGRMVKQTCEEQGAKTDNVHELARVLRVPGTFNVKNPDDPQPVVAEQAPGAPLTVAEINDRLNEYGFTEMPSDATTSGTGPVVSTPDDWRHTNEPCRYAVDTINGWRTDTPNNGRHPWLLAQAVRLMAMHRRGCLTEELHRRGYDVIETRFTEMCVQGIGGEPREVKPNEIDPEAWQFGVAEVSRMSDEHLDAELGSHPHWTDMANGMEVVLAEIVDDDDPPPGNNNPPPPGGAGGGGAGGGGGQQVTLTDSGNADMLVFQHAHRLRYCADLSKWLVWDGTRWVVRPDDGEAFQSARRTIDAIQDGGDQQIARHKVRSLSAQKLTAMVSLGKRNAAMRVGVDQLDADPYILNTPNGIVSLRNGNLTPSDPNAWCTKQTGCGVNLDAEPTRWLAFLNQTFAGDEELVTYMQDLAGIAAIGEVREHILPFFFGSGANGKSVLAEVLGHVLGDYAVTAPATFLLEGRDKHETEIARLRGARMVVCSEINRESKFDEAKVKLLTGGDTITGRFMRQDFFDFTPSHTLILMGNHQPDVTAGGTSFWRRLRLVPFTRTVPEEDRIDDLAVQLMQQEGEAILAWIVRGAQRVLADGLHTPQRVILATEDYSEDTKTGVARFLHECCTIGGTNAVESSAVYSSYCTWAFLNGEQSMTIQKFGREMSSNNVPAAPRRASGRRYFMEVHTEKLDNMSPANTAGRVLYRHSTQHWTDD